MSRKLQIKSNKPRKARCMTFLAGQICKRMLFCLSPSLIDVYKCVDTFIEYHIQQTTYLDTLSQRNMSAESSPIQISDDEISTVDSTQVLLFISNHSSNFFYLI